VQLRTLYIKSALVAHLQISQIHEDVMLVGHLPLMERLTAYLITGSFEKPVFKFQYSGIVCLNKDPTSGSWVIKWALMPHNG
jgi:phosphohistidine phosphatase